MGKCAWSRGGWGVVREIEGGCADLCAYVEGFAGWGGGCMRCMNGDGGGGEGRVKG